MLRHEYVTGWSSARVHGSPMQEEEDDTLRKRPITIGLYVPRRLGY
jgi:hypothetical protein